MNKTRVDSPQLDNAVEEKFEFACGRHCKLCPFPGYKCDGRPTKLNQEGELTAFKKLYSTPSDFNSRGQKITEKGRN